MAVDFLTVGLLVALVIALVVVLTIVVGVIALFTMRRRQRRSEQLLARLQPPAR